MPDIFLKNQVDVNEDGRLPRLFSEERRDIVAESAAIRVFVNFNIIDVAMTMVLLRLAVMMPFFLADGRRGAFLFGRLGRRLAKIEIQNLDFVADKFLYLAHG